MLDDTLQSQLAAYLERVTLPMEIVASVGDDSNSIEMRELLETIGRLRSDKITLRTDGTDARKPSFTLQRAGTATSLRFAGLPLGVDRWMLQQPDFIRGIGRTARSEILHRPPSGLKFSSPKRANNRLLIQIIKRISQEDVLKGRHKCHLTAV